MRKHMILLATVLLLTTVGSVTVIRKMRSLEKSVVLTVEDEKGNVSAAEGLRISFVEHVDAKGDNIVEELSNRQWVHTIRFDADGWKTESKMLQDKDEIIARKKEHEEYEEFLIKSQGNDFYKEYDIRSYDLYNYYYLREVLPAELLEGLEEGGEKREVRLSQYLEYYPMIYQLGLPNDQDSPLVFIKNAEYPDIDSGKTIYNTAYYKNLNPWEEDILFDNRINVDHRATAKAAEKLAEFLRIPVLENDVREFASELIDEEYNYFDVTQKVIGEDSYSPNFESAVTENAMYFTFHTHTEKGNVVDTSLIPGGYGIYILPYTIDAETGITTALADELRMFSPLDPEMEIETIYTDKTGKTMMVLYRLGEQYRVRLIDLKTGEVLCDDTVVAKSPEGLARWSIFADYGDDIFLVNAIPAPEWTGQEENDGYREWDAYRKNNARLTVFGKKEDGTYGKLLDANEIVEYAGGGYMAFEAGRFVQVVDVYDMCVSVFVYTNEGLAYKGSITSSFREALKQVEESRCADEIWGVECRWE